MTQFLTTINNTNQIFTLAANDLFPVYQTINGSPRKTSLNTIQEYLQTNLSSGYFIPQYISQYSAPNASGFIVQINDNSNNTHLILTPIAAYAAGTITLPQNTNLIDKQLVLVNSTQAVTALTVSGNGATVTGAPTTLSQNGFFTLKYDITLNTWYRIG